MMKKHLRSFTTLFFMAVLCCTLTHTAQAVTINVSGTVTLNGQPMRSQYIQLIDSISRKDTAFFTQSGGVFNVPFRTTSSVTQGYIILKMPDCKGRGRKDTVLRYTSSITSINQLQLERCAVPQIPRYKVHVSGKVNHLPNQQLAVRISGKGLFNRLLSTDASGGYSGYVYTDQNTGTIEISHEDCNGNSQMETRTYTYNKDTLFTGVNFTHCVNPAYIAANFEVDGLVTGNVDIECSLDNFKNIAASLQTGMTGRAKTTIPITAGSSGILYIRYKNCQDEWITDTANYYSPSRYFFHFPMVICSDTLPTKYSGKVFRNGNVASFAKVEVVYWDATNRQVIKLDTVETNAGTFSFKLRANEEALVRGFLTAADPDFGDYAPSYFPDVIDWSQATLLTYSKADKLKNKDIYLVQAQAVNGSNTIKGKVDDQSGAVPKLGKNTLLALFNAADQLVFFTTADAQNEFNLKNIDDASYTLAAYELGKYTNKGNIAFKWDNGSQLDVLAKITTDSTFIELADWSSVQESAYANLRLYPNPAQDQIRIEGLTAGEHDIQMRTVTGQLVTVPSISSTSTPTLDVSALPAGTYLLEIRKDDQLKHVSRIQILDSH